jgi:hypothetical protein
LVVTFLYSFFAVDMISRDLAQKYNAVRWYL